VLTTDLAVSVVATDVPGCRTVKSGIYVATGEFAGAGELAEVFGEFFPARGRRAA
jgi:hypothetical protein